MTRYVAGRIEILAGDFLALDAATFGRCDAVYDRAALIALPPAMRQRYVDHLAGMLPAGARGLLIGLEYPPGELEGPPFPVPEAEVRERLAPWFDVAVLARTDALADSDNLRQRGLSALTETAYALTRR